MHSDGDRADEQAPLLGLGIGEIGAVRDGARLADDCGLQSAP